MLHASTGQFQEAVRYIKEALLLHDQPAEPFPLGVGVVLHGLAGAYAKSGKLDAAVDTYRQAVERRRKIGHRQGEADSLRSLGATMRESGKPDGAEAAWQKALTILEELGHSDAAEVRAQLEEFLLCGHAATSLARMQMAPVGCRPEPHPHTCVRGRSPQA